MVYCSGVFDLLTLDYTEEDTVEQGILGPGCYIGFYKPTERVVIFWDVPITPAEFKEGGDMVLNLGFSTTSLLEFVTFLANYLGLTHRQIPMDASPDGITTCYQLVGKQ